MNVDDPHPTPWIRVEVSAALGQALYPQPAWNRLTALWESYYPLDRVPEEQLQLLHLLEKTMPALVAVLANHRPAKLRGRSLVEALDLAERQPDRLRLLLDRWRMAPAEMYDTAPTVVFAAIGQGRVDGRITPEEESTVVGKLLNYWALKSTLQAAANCLPPPQSCRCRATASTHAQEKT